MDGPIHTYCALLFIRKASRKETGRETDKFRDTYRQKGGDEKKGGESMNDRPVSAQRSHR